MARLTGLANSLLRGWCFVAEIERAHFNRLQPTSPPKALQTQYGSGILSVGSATRTGGRNGGEQEVRFPHR